MNQIKTLFKAKHWQIFTFFMLIGFVPQFFFGFDSISTVFGIIYITAFTGWLLMIGTGLKSIAKEASANYTLFLFAGATVVLLYVVAKISVAGNRNTVQGPRDPVMLLVLAIIILVAMIVLCSYVAKNLNRIEKGNDIDINDYFGDIFWLLMWPLGIWSIQPRLNRIANRVGEETPQQ